MTDERACEQRDQIEALAAKVDGLMAFERSHLLDYHANLKAGEAAFLIQQNRENAAELERRWPLLQMLIEDVQGKEVVDPVTGHMIDREPSIRKLLEQLMDQAIVNHEQAVTAAQGSVSIAFSSKIAIALIGIVSSAITAGSVILAAYLSGGRL